MAFVWIIYCRRQAARFLDVIIRRLRVSTIATTVNLVARNNLLRGEDWKLASLHEHLRFDFFGRAESPATGSCVVSRGSMSSERGKVCKDGGFGSAWIQPWLGRARARPSRFDNDNKIYAYRTCISEMRIRYADRKCTSDMHMESAYGLRQFILWCGQKPLFW